MRLADFILADMEHILMEWETFARGIAPGAKMEPLALRDDAQDILKATVQDMKSSQSAAERAAKSRGQGNRGPDGAALSSALNGASERHAIGRLGSGFDLSEVVSEYRALRASVLRLWRDSGPAPDERDVDDVTRFDESIDQSLAKAVSSYTQRVDQARDLFLAILSHDLRNPLNSISMSAQLIPQEGTLDARSSEAAMQISTSAAVMARMISDLLDYTRTRLGAGMPVSPAPTDLGSLCRAIYEEYRTAHPNRVIRFHADSAAGVGGGAGGADGAAGVGGGAGGGAGARDFTGEWDADRLRQAISNVLGNAVQHGDENAPIDLTLSGDEAEVVVVIHNGGAPIPPGELTRIFDPLVRGSSAEYPKHNRPGSIGLGLYIAREVARSHGGTIDVTSTRQAGTAFTFRLPRHGLSKRAQPILDEAHLKSM
jgi:signal transduction histidine kinase